MTTKLILTLLIALAFSSCKKDSTSTDLENKYYFDYTVSSKTNGYSYSKNALDIWPSSEWSTIGMYGGQEIVGGAYPTPAEGLARMTAFVIDSNAYIQSFCNSTDRPRFDNYIALKKLIAGTFTLLDGVTGFRIMENSSSSVLLAFWDNRQQFNPEESLIVTITTVEPIGGLVKGK
jgi:hypothetical protein